ncbi:MAG: hypothetical protein CMJ49_00100 [Planctomycetaceae bacterium]|nr:hypothetical protein [Planctomycetaceae bacterium]
MIFEYSKWDATRAAFQQRLDELMKLFRWLLNRAAGDADTALDWLDHLAEKYGLWGDGIDRDEFEKQLRETGEVERDAAGSHSLTHKGERAMRSVALKDLFGELRKSGGPGEHRARHTGSGGEPEPFVKPYTFGDDLWSIAVTPTITNAVRRSFERGEDDMTIQEEDLMVHETQDNTQCATALLVDCSHSMVLYGEDRMSPARSVTMGLVEMIQTRFPRDRLHVIAFGDDAVEVPLAKVPYLSWGPYHTNTKAALEMARELLTRSRCPNRQVFMITDGKPTVLDEGGHRYIDAGWLNPRIINRTLDEAGQCRRKGISITTFMMTDDPVLTKFVEQLTEINQGRAYYTGTGKLGQFLMVDYLQNRKRNVR